MLIRVGLSGRKVIFRGMNFSIEQSAVDFIYRNRLRYIIDRYIFSSFLILSYIIYIYTNILNKKATFALKLEIYIYILYFRLNQVITVR